MRLLLLLFISTSFASEGQIYLLSYPRSGNTWVRYCIEFLSKCPTGELRYLGEDEIHHGKTMNHPLANHFPLEIDYAKPQVIKIHDWNDDLNPESDSLIVIVRNYRECMGRHLGGIGTILDQKYERKRYLKILETYDQWPAHRRQLLFYEDLIQSPKESLQQLTHFLHGDPSRVSQFLKSYRLHKTRTLKLYHELEQVPQSFGSDPLFHSKKASQNLLQWIDLLFERSNPYLYKKYLKRYKVKS